MRWTRVFLLAAIASAASAAARAQPFEIPVVLPLTGGAAFLGQGERDALQIQETIVNQQGGIAGTPIHYVFHDDQSSPQVAVQLASQIKAGQPPIILGSAIVAMCNAMAPLLQGGPVLYCLSPGVHPGPGSSMFTSFISTHDLARALVRYYRGRGFTRIAMITSTDATGQDARAGFEETMKLPENAGLTMAAAVQFNPSDVSVAAQIQQIKSADPQALIAWTTGSPMGTVLKGVVQGGLDVPVGTTDANMTNAQMAQYAAFMPKEMLFMSSEWPPHGPDVQLDPRVVAAQTPMFAAYQAAKLSPDIAAALAWDPGLLAVGRAAQRGQVGDPRTDPRLHRRHQGLGRDQRHLRFSPACRSAAWTRTTPSSPAGTPTRKIWVIVSRPGGTPL